ncbi:MAG: NADPH-dependent curcumin reductase [Rhodocyclaceae bacterium]|nr:MAG: NADP-dependent oxidoreductase [Rhodocyclaceae bacterium]MBV6407914.1 NADPH-dependent curcumin reductase [Rhodocyclaceae bacterium]CAG0932918.1 NADPH-dependent curcumin reductase [Rhodocyclaceae bacterium]
MSETNRQILLASRPTGWVEESNFKLAEAPVPAIADGQVLVRNHWLSLDPYMRGRMNDAKSYAAPVKLGEVMIGGTAGEVVASKNPKFAVGDKVVGYLGWQLYGVSDGTMLMKVDDRHIPLSAYLGPVGMPGVTAWYGLMDLCQPKAGETVVVTAASGAVGSVVGQLAKMKGCRAVGIAGGTEKCRYVVGELGFDACIDYKAGKLWPDIKAATPDGIDCLFENVGGEIFDTLLGRMNAFSRIALCGLIAQYNSEPYPMKNIGSVLINRIRMQGFIVSEHMERWPVALAELGQGVATGKIKYRETVAQGLGNAPQAFIGLLKGANLGKQLVKLI